MRSLNLCSHGLELSEDKIGGKKEVLISSKDIEGAQRKVDKAKHNGRIVIRAFFHLDGIASQPSQLPPSASRPMPG